MTQKDVRKAISRYGKYKEMVGKKSVYTLPCSACGKELRSDTPEDVIIGASMTKRGSLVVWCEKCEGKVWDSKIK